MLTYNRGQWIDDHDQEDIWADGNEHFYQIYEKDAAYTFGNDCAFEVAIYRATDKNLKYPYAAFVGDGNFEGMCMWVCLPDFLSIFMLIKEAAPIISYEKDKDMLEVQEEEHQWKAKNLEPYQYRKECGHVV